MCSLGKDSGSGPVAALTNDRTLSDLGTSCLCHGFGDQKLKWVSLELELGVAGLCSFHGAPRIICRLTLPSSESHSHLWLMVRSSSRMTTAGAGQVLAVQQHADLLCCCCLPDGRDWARPAQLIQHNLPTLKSAEGTALRSH